MGIRLSPHGAFNSTGSFTDTDAQFLALAGELSSMKLAYLHLVDHSAMGAPPVPAMLKAALRDAFKGSFIVSGGFDAVSAEAALREGRGDLVAFGRPFIANPDLVSRMQSGAALAAPDFGTFYTADAVGYTDYPALGA